MHIDTVHPETLPRVPLNRFFSCQRVAARTRNGAVDALQSHDIGAIAFRYLHSRYQQRSFRRNALVGVWVPIAGWVYALINGKNSRRCRKTHHACEAALQQALQPPVFQALRQYRHGYSPYLELLHTSGVDITEAERLRATHGALRRLGAGAPKTQ